MIEVNYLAIVVATVGAMALGFAWYQPALFGKIWIREMGYSEKELKEDQKKMGKYYGMSFVVTVLMAYVLNHVIGLSMAFYNYAPIMTGITSAFWMWLGFVAPVQVTGVIFSRERNWKLLKINTGYQLVSLLVMGIVIGFMG